MSKIKFIRNILYVLGLILFLLIIAFSVYHTDYMWTNEFKSYNFNSFAEYFFTRAKGEILLAIMVASIPVSVGSIIYANNKSK